MIKIEKDNYILESFPVGEFQMNSSIFYLRDTRDAIVIDPGNDFAYLNDKITTKKLNLKKIIHTHSHFDHAGQSSTLKKHYNVPMALHADDCYLYDNLATQAQLFGHQVNASEKMDFFFKEDEFLGLDQDPYKNIFKVIHTPGHSLGSCCFYTEVFEAPLLIAGDTIFKQSIGRTDLPGGNMEQLITSIKSKILILPDNTQIISGHGPITNIADEKKLNPFL